MSFTFFYGIVLWTAGLPPVFGRTGGLYLCRPRIHTPEKVLKMNANQRSFRFSASLCLSALLCAVAPAQHPAPLRDVAGAQDPMAGTHGLRRSRVVEIDRPMLDEAGAGSSLLFGLFEDMAFRAVVERREALGEGRYNIHGHLAGLDGSQFVISVVPGAVAGAFYPNDGRSSVVIQGAPGMAVVRQYEEGAVGCGAEDDRGVLGAPRVEQRQAAPTAAFSAVGCTETGDVIRVLQVYTPDAETQAGGAAQIDAQSQLLFAELNNCVGNAGITTLQFVRAGLHKTTDNFLCTGTTSDNWDNTLSGLTDTNDGYMDDVHAVRSSTSADLVALLVRTDATCQGTTAGLAGILQSTDGRPESSPAFSVSIHSQISVMPHEVGHNMGCAHDCFTGCGNGITATANGHKWNGSQPGTSVMGYPDRGRPYYPIFSTPSVQVGNAAAGTSGADNASALLLTKQVVANYRGGCVEVYGTGCAGGIGLTGTPSPGQVYNVTGWSPTGQGTLYMGVSDSTWGPLPLPFHLQVIGSVGCYFNATPNWVLWSGNVMPTVPNQFILIPVPIPNDPFFTGIKLYHQWHYFQTGNPGSTYRTSRGLAVEIDV